MKRILLAAAAAMILIHPASAQRADYESMKAQLIEKGDRARIVHRRGLPPYRG